MSQDLQISQLRAFATVARFHSYTRAAAYLAYSAPAVHLQVKSLEQALQVPLIRRNGQSVTVTIAGQRLLTLVDDVLARVDDLAYVAKDQDRPVELGTGHQSELVMPPVAAYLRSQDRYRVQVQTLSRGGLARGLTDGSLDLVIAGNTAMEIYQANRGRYQLSLARWTFDEWALVGPPSTEADYLRHVAADQIFLPKDSVRAEHILRAYVLPAFQQPPRLSMLGATLGIRSALENNLGLALLPLSRIRDMVLRGDVRILQRFGKDGEMPIYLLHRRPSSLSASSRDFLRFLIKQRTKFAPPIESLLPSVVAPPIEPGSDKAPGKRSGTSGRSSRARRSPGTDVAGEIDIKKKR